MVPSGQAQSKPMITDPGKALSPYLMRSLMVATVAFQLQLPAMAEAQTDDLNKPPSEASLFPGSGASPKGGRPA